MNIKYKVIAPLGFVALLAAGCGSTASTSNYPSTNTTSQTPATNSSGSETINPNPPVDNSSTTPPVNANVNITSSTFNPSTITVKKGTTITWLNSDSIEHAVTGDNGGPTSSNLAKGATYSYTYNQVGTFPYHCALHPNMKGTVVVTE